MGQDEIYLQVIATSGEAHERRDAKKVLKLLKRGKHWVLVTLLLGNVITNETLPIVLDRSLGGGWPAVLGSTVLIGKAPDHLLALYWWLWEYDSWNNMTRWDSGCTTLASQHKATPSCEYANTFSHLRRNRPSICLRPLRASHWRLDVSFCSRPHVDTGPGCLAYCQIARLPPG